MANSNNSNNRNGGSNGARNKNINNGNVAQKVGVSRSATSERPTTPVSPGRPGSNLPGNGNEPRRLTPKQQAMLKRQRIRRRNQIIIASVLVLALVALGVIAFAIANAPANFQNLTSASTTTADTAPFTIGDPNAKVTLTEWGDFRCSSCDTFFNNVEPAILSDYVKTNKIKFVFKNFITIDGNNNTGDSHHAAEAGWCAADQSHFWDFYQNMYTNYPGEQSGYWTGDRLKSLAKQIGLDTTKFNACYDSGQHRQDVINQSQQASQNGFQGTPTLTVNDKPMTANFADLNAIKAELDQDIANATGSATTPGAKTTPGAAATPGAATAGAATTAGAAATTTVAGTTSATTTTSGTPAATTTTK